MLRYEAVRSAEDEALRGRIIDLAQQRRRFGYGRIHALLRREGAAVNHTTVLRLYREEGFAVRKSTFLVEHVAAAQQWHGGSRSGLSDPIPGF